LIDKDEEIEVPSVGDRPARCLSRRTLVEVVEPRYEELFQLIQAELRSAGFEDMLAAGVVLTGGSSLVDGAVELAEEVFHMPVRLGYPQGVVGLTEEVNSPSFATTVGLLMYAKEHFSGVVHEAPKKTSSLDVITIFDRMRNWFKSSF
ncbi:MAG: cell division protein FtsA, partial [Thiomicrorhabdus sp.]|nr:cell division protein FtsA [Thiomicrorhabdus sp.]